VNFNGPDPVRELARVAVYRVGEFTRLCSDDTRAYLRTVEWIDVGWTANAVDEAAAKYIKQAQRSKKLAIRHDVTADWVSRRLKQIGAIATALVTLSYYT
jgi:aspartate aminotransferase-like enzyme